MTMAFLCMLAATRIQDIAQTLTQLATGDDHVDRAVIQQELAALEAFRQLLTHGLLDHPRAGKTDQRTRLGNDHVAKHGQAGRDTAIHRVGQHGDKRYPLFTQACQGSAGLGHLHQ